MSHKRLALTAVLALLIAVVLGTTGTVSAIDNFADSNVGIANRLASTPVSDAGTVGMFSREQCVRNGTYATNRSESHLAVDPTNPNRMLGSSKFFFSGTDPFGDSGTYGQLVDWSGEYQFHVGVYDIMNGTPAGNMLVPGYNCAYTIRLNQQTLQGFEATTDPVTAFDTLGNAYAFQLAFNYSDYKNGMYVSKRDPSGHWGSPVQVDSFVGLFGGGHVYDKQWIAIDTSGGLHTDNIYLIYVDFSTSVGRIKFSRSTDHGATFSRPTTIGQFDNPHAQLPQIGVDSRGLVYAVWHGNFQGPYVGQGSMVAMVSEDAGDTWHGPIDAIDFNWVTADTPGTYGGRVVQNTTFREGLPYYFATDAHGPFVYTAEERWNTDPSLPGHLDVVLHRGYYDVNTHTMAWQRVGLANDNTTPTDSFQPAVAADSGTVAVAWYDRRLSCGSNRNYFTRPGATNYCINTAVQFYDETGSGLVPRGTNIRASATTWDPQQPGDWLTKGVGDLPHSQYAACFSGGLPFCETFLGDYFGLAIARGSAYILNISTAPQFNNTRVIPPSYRFWNASAQYWQNQTVQAGGNTKYYQQQVLQIVPRP